MLKNLLTNLDSRTLSKYFFNHSNIQTENISIKIPFLRDCLCVLTACTFLLMPHFILCNVEVQSYYITVAEAAVTITNICKQHRKCNPLRLGFHLLTWSLVTVANTQGMYNTNCTLWVCVYKVRLALCACKLRLGCVCVYKPRLGWGCVPVNQDQAVFVFGQIKVRRGLCAYKPRLGYVCVYKPRLGWVCVPVN